MLEFLDPEDRYVVYVARLTVEAATLPADVKEEFRQWVLMDLLMRGSGALSDYFFSVVRANGVTDDDAPDSLMFGAFLASELYRFLRTDKGRGLSLAPKPRPIPVAPVWPRIASPIGPSLPPTMAASAREAGHVLSAFEDPDDPMWTPLEPELCSDCEDAADDESLHGEEVVHLPLIEAGKREPGCGVSLFRRACCVAACAEGFPGRPPDGRFGRAGATGPPDLVPPDRPPPVPDGVARVRAPSPVRGADGRLRPPSGLFALVEDVFHSLALRELGDEPSLQDALAWTIGRPGRAYGGQLRVSATFSQRGGSLRPARWFIARDDHGDFSVAMLLASMTAGDVPVSSESF